MGFDAQSAAAAKLVGSRSREELVVGALVLLAGAIALGSPVAGMALLELTQVSAGEPGEWTDPEDVSTRWFAASALVPAALLILAIVPGTGRGPRLVLSCLAAFSAALGLVAVGVGCVLVVEALLGGLVVALAPERWLRRDRR